MLSLHPFSKHMYSPSVALEIVRCKCHCLYFVNRKHETLHCIIPLLFSWWPLTESKWNCLNALKKSLSITIAKIPIGPNSKQMADVAALPFISTQSYWHVLKIPVKFDSNHANHKKEKSIPKNSCWCHHVKALWTSQPKLLLRRHVIIKTCGIWWKISHRKHVIWWSSGHHW